MRARRAGLPAVPFAAPLAAPFAVLLAVPLATATIALDGCGHSDLPSRDKPSYTSPDGEIRFWAPPSWRQRSRGGKSWHVRYHTGPEAASEQRHALAWMSADYVPERSDEHGATLFRLFVFTTAGYETLAAEPGMPIGVPIAAGGGRVAVAWIPTMDAYAPESYSPAEYLRMRPGLDTLRAAIRLAGGEAGTSAPWGADTVTYSIRLPAADAPGREIRARFAPDGSATWTTTYFGKGWPIVERAGWTVHNGEVTLDFKGVGSGGPAGPLTYAIADSALVPVAWPHEAWGSIGAPLLVYRRG